MSREGVEPNSCTPGFHASPGETGPENLELETAGARVPVLHRRAPPGTRRTHRPVRPPGSATLAPAASGGSGLPMDASGFGVSGLGSLGDCLQPLPCSTALVQGWSSTRVPAQARLCPPGANSPLGSGGQAPWKRPLCFCPWILVGFRWNPQGPPYFPQDLDRAPHPTPTPYPFVPC